MKIINVVGARPNFMKIAPIIDALNKRADVFEHLLVHTGQHYDARMNQDFFRDLGMPLPDINLGVGSGSHAEQTAQVMVGFEKVCLAHQPDLVIVVGDVNSTMACAITAKKLGIRVAHVEAGLRSHDMSMPEEINRLCTDVLSDYLFTTDRGASANLAAQGIAAEKIVFVGNVMIDTLQRHRVIAERLDLVERMGLERGGYITATLHRPSNVDDRETLEGILQAFHEIARQMPIVFPMHPRTRKMIENCGLVDYIASSGNGRGLIITEPMGYLEFLHMNMNARMVITDSGGLQEETTVLGVPCITLRFNTERPITVEQGTNVIVGNRKDRILAAFEDVMAGSSRRGNIPEFWDGGAATRIVDWLAARG